ncbi:MAG: cysteine desulfurase family protein [Hyphomicrobiaceae bacterium]
MSVSRTYLDWNATAPLRADAKAAMIATMDAVGNPSSVHAEGRRVRAMIEAARDEVAELVGADPANVIFTSGATEANAAVLAQGWQHILRSDAEHDSVRNRGEGHEETCHLIPVGRDGVVMAGEVARLVLTGDGLQGSAIVAMQGANNETGVVQPVADVSRFARDHGLYVLCDGVQLAGRVPVAFDELGAHYLTLSAHKLGGPKGIGALVLSADAPFRPLIAGGGQERRRRGGTENVVGIAGFGAAARAARLAGDQEAAWCLKLREMLEAGIARASPEAIVVGRGAPRLPNTTCVALPGRLADVMVMALDLEGVSVSAGAACSSGKVTASATLAAMGLVREVAQGAIRVSVGPTTTEDDIAAFLAVWRDLANARQKAA